MEFNQLVENRRSIRKFQDRRISTELVMDIIRDSCKAPSAMNSQPWRFIVINDKPTMKRLSDESKANILNDIAANPNTPIAGLEDLLRKKDFNVFYNAPCLVYIIGPADFPSIYTDCALAASYFMFSATARGLGTCWIGLGRDIRSKELLDKIGLPNDHFIVAPIIIGYPEHIPEMTPRDDPQILKWID